MTRRRWGGKGVLAVAAALASIGLGSALADGPADDDGSRSAPDVTSRAGLQGHARFGGHNAVGGQIASDDRVAIPLIHAYRVQRALQPYYDAKGRVNDSIGLAFGGDYNVLVQGADESPGEQVAFSGVARLFAQWTLVGETAGDSGALVVKGEHRHAIATDIPPTDLAGELRYAGLTASTFSDGKWLLTNLYWQHHQLGDRVAFIAGVVDGTDFIDIYDLVNPWANFDNGTFLNSPTIPIPGAGLGVATRVRPTERTYLLVGLSDRNGDPSQPGQTFERLFTRGEVIVYAELGRIPAAGRPTHDGIHLGGWYATAQREPATPSGWGLVASWSHVLGDRLVPFVRGGYSRGGGSLVSGTVSMGLGLRLRSDSDQLGVGLAWSRPNEALFAGRPNQYTVEIYYRLKLLQNFDLTPDVQVLIRPAENPDQDVIGVFGLRGRLKF